MNVDHRNIDLEGEPPRRKGLPPVAKYVCGAAFVLSAGLAIPFFWAKSRATVPRAGVHLSGMHGNGSGPAALLARPAHSAISHEATISKPPPRLLKNLKSNEEAPPDTLGAIKHAFKALGVATLMVGVGAGTAFAGVTLGLGITTLGEFHTVMRSAVRMYFPELHAQLHSVPDTLAGHASSAGTNTPTSAGAQRPHPIELWDQERVDKALEDAYARGGWRAWIVEARRQLERERAVAHRRAEYERGR